MTFTVFGPPARMAAGFVVVAGRHNGLRDLMVLGGRLMKRDVSPVHRHDGDEVIRVVSGSVLVRIGDETRVCRAGDVAVLGPGVPHGFEVRSEAVVEVVAGYRIGTSYPVVGQDGEEWHEVHRRDMPWGRPPPEGRAWTTDEELNALVARISRTV